MPCVVCREVVVGPVSPTVHATDDYLQWASSHCARTPATANGDLAQPQALAQPNPAQRTRPHLYVAQHEDRIRCCCQGLVVTILTTTDGERYINSNDNLNTHVK